MSENRMKMKKLLKNMIKRQNKLDKSKIVNDQTIKKK